MKAVTAPFLILLTACVGSSVNAHPSAIPLVELKVSLTDDALTYEARIPTFAIGPLAGYDLAEGDSLPTSTEEVEAFFAEACPVKIDGIAVRPVLAEILICAPELPSTQYGKPSWEDDADGQDYAATAKGQPARWVEAKMKLVYSTKGTTRQVSMVWNVFTADGADALGLLNPFGIDAFGGPDIGLTAGSPDEVIAVSQLMGRRSFLTFTPEEPEYVWHSDVKARRGHGMGVVPAAAQKTIQLPLVSIAATVLLILFLAAARFAKMPRGLLAGATLMVLLIGIVGRDVGRVEIKQFWRDGVELPAEPQAKEIFTVLHRNVYRAFDYDTEDAIYDALAQSVSGELLDETYNDVYQSLVLQDQGGAICKIENVEMLESKMMASDPDVENAGVEFRVSCRWVVKGLVEHWGHAHRRVNRYGAVYTLRPFGDSWRIYDVEINEQERILGNAGR
ncbi:MAG: hypothetical protein QF437_22250 [Planctomycetota bacterium]|nr:hypothetical protein [Planctomycetota bacterium]